LACAPKICAVKDEHLDPNDCQDYDPAHPPEIAAPPVPTPELEPECPAPMVVADGCGCVQGPPSAALWVLVVGLWWRRRPNHE